MVKSLHYILIVILTLFSFYCSKDIENKKVISENDLNNVIEKNVSAQNEKAFVLGITPHDKREKLIKGFTPFVEYLSEKLGRKVNLLITRNYDELGRILNENKIDFAIISPTSYVKSKYKYPKLKYVATVVGKKTNKAYYHGVIITRKNSGIKTYRDLKNKYFAFVEKSSGSGFVFPVSLMINRWGIEPKTYFKSTFFMGNHSNVIKAVLSGQAHAGSTWEKPLENSLDKVRILLKSPPIPLDAFAVKPQTHKSLIIKLRRILLSINKNTKTSSGKVVIKDYYYKGFVVKNNAFYNIIRETLKTVQVWQNKWKNKE